MMDKFEKKNEPIIIKNTDFERCILFISFPIKTVDDVKLRMLKNMAFDKSSTYNTDRKIYEVNVNNYCISYRGKVVSIGNSYFLELTLEFPSEKSLGKDVLLDNLKFVKDIIYNPYLENGIFPLKDVDDIVNIIKNDIYRNFKDVFWYYEYKNDKTIDENNYLIDNVTENSELLDMVTSKDLYDLYNKIISEPPFVFLIGNVDEVKAGELIKDILLDNKISAVSFDKKYYNFAKRIPSEVQIIREITNFKSSCVFYNYKIKDMSTEKDIALLKIVQNLLNSGSSKILFNTLRKDRDLVYRCGAYIYSSFGSLSIWAMTGKNNIEICDECIDMVMKEIADINFISEKLALITEEAELEDRLTRERIYDILMDNVDKFIECKKKSFYEIVKDIIPYEIKDFIENRLVLVTKYIGVGEDNE